MGGGPPGFRRGFTCPALLGIPVGRTSGFRARGFHPLRRRFPAACANHSPATARSRNPAGHARRFGLFRLRSPLLTESRLISSPPGTEMFHFPGYCLPALWIHAGMTPHQRRRIAPFGNPRIKGRLRLPVDYRGLPRPSSPAVAKASIMRLNNLTVKNDKHDGQSQAAHASPQTARLAE